MLLDAVVGLDGTVTEMRIVYGLEPRLDLAAQEALRQWRFKPGTFKGSPAAILVQIEEEFRLR